MSLSASLHTLFQRFNALRGRRIFIIPTRYGLLYGLFTLLILLGAINYSNSLGHVLSFLLACLGFVVMLHTYRNLAPITLKQVKSTAVFAGQPIPFELVLSNASHRNSYYLELASRQIDPPSWSLFSWFSRYHSCQPVPCIAPQSDSVVRYVIASQHRGKQPLGKVRISTCFPLGLFNSWTYFPTNEAAIIYPKPAGSLPLPVTNSQTTSANRHVQEKGMDDFSGFKRYRAGDPLHAIAWKAMARDDIMRTKQFNHFIGPERACFSWEDVATLPDTESRLSQLCQWIITAEHQGLRYGLTLPGCTIPTGQGRPHYHQCLTALACYE